MQPVATNVRLHKTPFAIVVMGAMEIQLMLAAPLVLLEPTSMVKTLDPVQIVQLERSQQKLEVLNLTIASRRQPTAMHILLPPSAVLALKAKLQSPVEHLASHPSPTALHRPLPRSAPLAFQGKIQLMVEHLATPQLRTALHRPLPPSVLPVSQAKFS